MYATTAHVLGVCFAPLTHLPGSFFYAAREIPGLEKSKLPVTLCDGTTTRGDTMRCLSIQKFTAPTVLQQHPRTAQGQNMIKFDGLRCKNCTRTFPNEQKLLAHCRDTGHGLILGEDNENDKLVPSTVENFVVCPETVAVTDPVSWHAFRCIFLHTSHSRSVLLLTPRPASFRRTSTWSCNVRWEKI